MKVKRFKRGFKQYKVMDAMRKNQGLKYSEIIKLAYELSNGEGSFDPIENRGVWSGPFQTKPKCSLCGLGVDGWITKYCVKINKKYFIDGYEAFKIFNKLKEKFKGMSIDDACIRIDEYNV